MWVQKYIRPYSVLVVRSDGRMVKRVRVRAGTSECTVFFSCLTKCGKHLCLRWYDSSTCEQPTPEKLQLY